ncbi:methyltransferase domain-containing protein [Alcanivorax sp. JB21]|uniref:putative RNA methyltransferase n=1 Tax=Alcanivorax limicola TaxID=2874102 RepID=UPI001CBD5032|nr:methyltransferase domain-containing protein [Alcanivorax limicola]MBZ2187741.1 methyltransferase domain-containing protein [Alcanivorax limicola]
MAITPFDALACPLDGNPLHCQDGVWRCADGHSFDIARQGYVNLLPVQNKRSRDPGDSKEMVAARSRFLAAGFYDPIAEAVNAAVLGDMAPGQHACCLDAGCGEGHYLRSLASAAGARHLSLLGLDISKWAVQAAARRALTAHGGLTADSGASRWVVGSNARLPVLSGTLDQVLCLFGFPVYPEFSRVLRPGGMLLQVDAGQDHLRELRQVIYPSLKPERPPEDTAPPGFTLQHQQHLRYPLTLRTADLVADLLAMTPHLYRASHEGRARAAALTSIRVIVDVRLTMFRSAT